MPLWLEYKYVIRGKSEFRWEDFGHRTLPVFSSTSPATATSFMPEWSEVGKPLNRLLPFCRGRRLKPGLMLRVDSFGSWVAKTEASWSALKHWSPAIAGMSAVLRRSSFVFASGGRGIDQEDVVHHAERVFGQQKRARLLLCLWQLRHSTLGGCLAQELWHRIGDYIGGLKSTRQAIYSGQSRT